MNKQPRGKSMRHDAEQAVRRALDAKEAVKVAQHEAKVAEHELIHRLIQDGAHECFSVNWSMVRRLVS